ncbi:hypothetical protein ACFU53_25490 [Streptomyces sp. NPDC057474]
MTGSALETNHFTRDHGIAHRPGPLPRTPDHPARHCRPSAWSGPEGQA